jgi:hypothetical protein
LAFDVRWVDKQRKNTIGYIAVISIKHIGSITDHTSEAISTIITGRNSISAWSALICDIWVLLEIVVVATAQRAYASRLALNAFAVY